MSPAQAPLERGYPAKADIRDRGIRDAADAVPIGTRAVVAWQTASAVVFAKSRPGA